MNIARRNRDTSACEEITNNDRKTLCYASVTNDASFCVEISESSEREGCYRQIALTTNDINLCEEITTDNINYCYFNVARKTKDINHCEKITDSSLRDRCLKEIEGGVS